MKLHVLGSFTKICLRVSVLFKQWTKITDTLLEDLRMFIIYSHVCSS